MPGLVSVGNEVDLSLGEICLATLDDPDIDSYLLFLETLRHADKLRAFAERAAAAGRPVLAYKLGRSAAARELALTHTGALAGEDDVADAFLRDCGIARVESLSALIEGPAFAQARAAPARAAHAARRGDHHHRGRRGHGGRSPGEPWHRGRRRRAKKPMRASMPPGSRCRGRASSISPSSAPATR